MERSEFERYRRHLEGIAYRMCGILADAQDVVQETYLRWHDADRASLKNPRSWLATVCTRLAIDKMRRTRVRREEYVGIWLPEPLIDTDWVDPAKIAQIDDSASLALMLALDKLSPSERATFILHDVFSYSFAEVASILGLSESACRKSASRARGSIRQDRVRNKTNPEEHKQLTDAFFEALHSGNLDTLKSLLQESVEFHSDGGGKVKTATQVLRGPEEVSAFFMRIWKEQVPHPECIQIITRWFNGSPGSLIYQNGNLVTALSFEIEDNKAYRIFAHRNPDKLKSFEGSNFESQNS